MVNGNLTDILIPLFFAILAPVILLWIIWRNYVFTMKEDQRAVLIRMGRFAGVFGPGRVVILPFIDRLILISLSTVRNEFPTFSVTTSEGMGSDLQMTVSSRITDPEGAVLKLENYLETMREFAYNFLSKEAEVSTSKQFRSWITYSSDIIRDDLAERMRPFGVVVEAVEISVV